MGPKRIRTANASEPQRASVREAIAAEPIPNQQSAGGATAMVEPPPQRNAGEVVGNPEQAAMLFPTDVSSSSEEAAHTAAVNNILQNLYAGQQIGNGAAPQADAVVARFSPVEPVVVAPMTKSGNTQSSVLLAQSVIELPTLEHIHIIRFRDEMKR